MDPFNKIYHIKPEQLEALGYEIIVKGSISPEDCGNRTDGKSVTGQIYRIVLQKIGDGTYQTDN